MYIMIIVSGLAVWRKDYAKRNDKTHQPNTTTITKTAINEKHHIAMPAFKVNGSQQLLKQNNNKKEK